MIITIDTKPREAYKLPKMRRWFLRSPIFYGTSLTLFRLFVLASISPSILAAGQSCLLTSDAIIQMTSWHISTQEIISAIDRNDTNFDLSPSSIALLKSKGVNDSVLQEMWKATLKSATGKTTGDSPATGALIAAKTTSQTTKAAAAADNNIPAHTDARLQEARRVDAKTRPVVPYDPPCPLSSDGKPPTRKVEIDWDSTSVSPSRVDHSGPTCFEVSNFNDILYLPGFTLTEKPITGNAIDLLTTAISTVSGINLGTASSTDSTKQANKTQAKQAANPTAPLTRPECPTGLQSDIKAATGTAALLQTSLSQLDPGKDSTGKINLIPLSMSRSRWQPIPGQFEAFQTAVLRVITDLKQDDADVCSDATLAAAEAIVIDVYLKLQQVYPEYADHADARASHVARYTSNLDSTSGYDFAVKVTYQGSEVTNGTKTFSLSAGRQIASASGGFLLTEIAARSYTSVTVPSGMTNPATQTVLGVNGNGPQIGVVGLVNFNLPDIPWFRNTAIPLSGRHYGLAISAGPTYGLSNGKSDASRIGFLGGVSLQLWNQLFLTPGVNVGQFSDFPQGFTAPGQLIPANTGTPQGVNRTTARFAVGITYKIKDFGSTQTKSNTDSATTGSVGTQGTTGGTPGSTTKKAKTSGS